MSEEQQMLADSLRGTLARVSGEAVWPALAELGALGALLPEDQGGFGGTGGDIAAVFATLGASGAVVPALLETGILGAGVLAAAGQDDLAAQAMAGDLRLALADLEPDLSGMRATAVQDGRIHGTKTLVVDGEAAQALIVTAQDGLWLVQADAPGVLRRGFTLMGGGRGAEVTFDGAPGQRLGDLSLLDRPRAAAILALCADAVGVMDAAAALTADYLKTRKQFGRPLSAFQVLQHRLVDVVIEIEQARSAVQNLADHLDAASDLRDRHVAATKNLTGRAALKVAEEAVQMHGGIGMTEEYALAAMVRRLLACDARFGTADEHLADFARLTAA